MSAPINCKHELEFGRENLDRVISSLTDKVSKLSAKDQEKLAKNIREAYDKLDELTLQYNDAEEENAGRDLRRENLRLLLLRIGRRL